MKSYQGNEFERNRIQRRIDLGARVFWWSFWSIVAVAVGYFIIVHGDSLARDIVEAVK